MTNGADLVVIGGGIVGLATGFRYMEEHPGRSVVVLEKESKIAQHQTGHNSGVLHSGIYYRPGSLKALNCREGKRAMEAFCAEEGINYDICGKVIVAVSEDELPAMNTILERGKANGVECERIGRDRLKELEPYANGIAAIHVPEAGIVDYRQVCRRLVEKMEANGGRVVTSARVIGLRKNGTGVVVETTAGTFSATAVANCAGLHSDRLASLSGEAPGVKIVPFRGEYYELTADARKLCRNLIYPVPDPSFPFLGVHFTRMIDGSVECGPNAVLAFAREGYRMTSINVRDLAETLSYPGFLRLARKYWKTGFGEMWRSISKKAFVKALQRLVPEISEDKLVSAPAGVRAQAITREGALVDDFAIYETENVINVCNAPSPAATASLNIGRHIVARLADRGHG